MKVVINVEWCGSFDLSDEAIEILGYTRQNFLMEIREKKEFRTNPELIKLIEERGSEFVSAWDSQLAIEDIPDDSTDILIGSEEGYETLYYVLNGKVFQAN